MTIFHAGPGVWLLWLGLWMTTETVLARNTAAYCERLLVVPMICNRQALMPQGSPLFQAEPAMQAPTRKESPRRVAQVSRQSYGRSHESKQASPALETCGVPGRGSGARIVGGTTAFQHEFPWMVSIKMKMDNKSIPFCGGTVINSRWVVTAKHCIGLTTTEKMVVVAGDHHLMKKEGAEQFSRVEKVETHPHNDIALLKLAAPLILNHKTVSPICLPPKNFSFTGKCVATGWGFTKEESSPSDILKKVVLPIVSDEKCRDAYENIKLISADMICAGYDDGGKDACKDDSGGPLICTGTDGRQQLAGVVSFGIGCAQPGVPGVYVEVSYFVDWINKIISNN